MYCIFDSTHYPYDIYAFIMLLLKFSTTPTVIRSEVVSESRITNAELEKVEKLLDEILTRLFLDDQAIKLGLGVTQDLRR